MIWIGLTGGIACGKSAVGQIIERNGFSVIDADKMTRQVMISGQRAYGEIVKIFGQGILDQSGEIDRKALGKRVFADPEKLKILEQIVHPEVKEAVAKKRRELASSGVGICFYIVPLLFEKKMEAEFDRILVVDCGVEEQRRRLKARDHLPDEQIEQRLKAQLPLADKKSKATLVFDNSKDLAHLEKQVVDYLQTLI